jgi:hypothetical protein
MIPTTPAQDQYRQCSCPNPGCEQFNRPRQSTSFTGRGLAGTSASSCCAARNVGKSSVSSGAR